MTSTIDYYDKNAFDFVSTTVHVNFSEIQDLFLSLLPTNAVILDFGCGSGRDTKYFMDHGCRVDAVDGSSEICRSASAFTGIEIQQMLFHELDAREKYDGIWACASILHLPKTELLDVLKKMCDALKDKGIIYASFKYGNFEGERRGRYFTDFTDKSFTEMLDKIQGLSMEKVWITSDVRTGRGDEKWLNLILRKTDMS